MGQDLLSPDGWSALLARLPAGFDVAAMARAHRAWRRARGVPSPAALLRLALVYADTPLSLRGTAAWAAASGVAEVSDVALPGRLRNAEGWLEQILGALLASRLGTIPPGLRRAVELVDATGLAAPGGRPGVGWRAHASFGLGRGSFRDLRLTPAAEAEGLARFTPAPGAVVVADRFYARAGGLSAIAERGGGLVVRHGMTGRALLDGGGRRIGPKDVLAREAELPDVADLPVRMPRPGGDAPPLPARLVLLRLPPEAAAEARARARRKARRQGSTAGPRRLASAGWPALPTTLGGEVPAEEALALHRLRWQVELAFKRLRGQPRLDDLQAKDPRLARATLLAELVLAALADQVLAEALALSPLGTRDARLLAARPAGADRPLGRPPG
jgi:hypothetical protein